MTLGQTAVYARFLESLEGDRLDYVAHHPMFDDVKAFRNSENAQRLGLLITSPEYGVSLSGSSEGDFGFLNVQHINSRGQLIFDPPTYVSGASSDKLLAEGDLLIARTGFTLGKTASVPADFAGYIFGSFCIRFRVNNGSYRSEFVARCLNSTCGRMQTLLLRTGSDRPNLNAEQVKDFHLPHISILDQDSILEEVCAIEREAAELDREAWLMREDISDDLPRELGLEAVPLDSTYFYREGAEGGTLSLGVFSEDLKDRLHFLFYHPRFEETIGALGQAYSMCSLAEIVREPIVRGVQPEYDDEGEIPVLKTVNLRNGSIDLESASRVSREFYERNTAAHVRKQDLLVTVTGFGSLGKADIYKGNESALVDTHVSILRLQADYSPQFLCYYLRSYLGSVQFDRWFSGSSGQIELQPADLGAFRVPSSSDEGIPLRRQRDIAARIARKLKRARRLEVQATQRWREAQHHFESRAFGDL